MLLWERRLPSSESPVRLTWVRHPLLGMLQGRHGQCGRDSGNHREVTEWSDSAMKQWVAVELIHFPGPSTRHPVHVPPLMV
ncbi:hypothetical protein Y1Q_0019985 [Alligator mississippiensis]|uniref:Uncharacterized protein n=1 Tax=Alligator mississippiensis TaxID=8496 RepID=A0A151PE32_ALLMI|nr:hypothetical protein Y1Q_0019985 [Alligator mississippiensis]